MGFHHEGTKNTKEFCSSCASYLRGESILDTADGEFGGGQVFERAADRFEKRDLAVVQPAGAFTARELEQVAGNSLPAESAGAERLDDVACLVQGRLGVDVNPRAPHRFVVGLAHLGRVAADQVE